MMQDLEREEEDLMSQIDTSRITALDDSKMLNVTGSPYQSRQSAPGGRRLNQTVDHKKNRLDDLDSDLNDRNPFSPQEDLFKQSKGKEIITPIKIKGTSGKAQDLSQTLQPQEAKQISASAQKVNNKNVTPARMNMTEKNNLNQMKLATDSKAQTAAGGKQPASTAISQSVLSRGSVAQSTQAKPATAQQKSLATGQLQSKTGSNTVNAQ